MLINIWATTSSATELAYNHNNNNAKTMAPPGGNMWALAEQQKSASMRASDFISVMQKLVGWEEVWLTSLENLNSGARINRIVHNKLLFPVILSVTLTLRGKFPASDRLFVAEKLCPHPQNLRASKICQTTPSRPPLKMALFVKDWNLNEATRNEQMRSFSPIHRQMIVKRHGLIISCHTIKFRGEEEVCYQPSPGGVLWWWWGGKCESKQWDKRWW